MHFDGQKDKTFKQLIESNAKYLRKIFNEEHISIIHEGWFQYLGHKTPGRSPIETMNAIVNFLTDNKVKMNQLTVVGCDRTLVNTGDNGGVIRLKKDALGKPLHWLISQLHAT